MLARLTAWAGLVSLGPCLAGCASIPRQSVDLSRQVGVGISRGRAAHLATLDAFYERLRDENDVWVVNTFLPRAMDNARAALSEACREAGDPSPDCGRLTEQDFKRLAAQIIRFRDELQAVLQRNHRQATRLIEEHYASLEGANAAVTALLAAAADLSDATRTAGATIAASASIDLDLDAIQEAVNQYLQKAGGAGAAVGDLEGQLSDILAGLDKPKERKENQP